MKHRGARFGLGWSFIFFKTEVVQRTTYPYAISYLGYLPSWSMWEIVICWSWKHYLSVFFLDYICWFVRLFKITQYWSHCKSSEFQHCLSIVQQKQRVLFLDSSYVITNHILHSRLLSSRWTDSLCGPLGLNLDFLGISLLFYILSGMMRHAQHTISLVCQLMYRK